MEDLEARRLLAAFQNPYLTPDVNDDGLVTPLDALVVINKIARSDTNLVSDLPPDSLFYNVSGDERVSPLDALYVINAIGRDTEPPQVILSLHRDTAPKNQTNSDLLTADPRLSIQAIDSTGIRSIEASIDGSAFEVVASDNRGMAVWLPDLSSGGADDGIHEVRVRSSDGLNQTSVPTTFSFVLDTVAPTVDFIALSSESDSGTVGDGITDSEFVNFIGVGEPNTEVELQGFGERVNIGIDGLFAFPSIQLPLGETDAIAESFDLAGNRGAASFRVQREFPGALQTLSEATGPYTETLVAFEVPDQEGRHTLSFDLGEKLGRKTNGSLIGDLLLLSIVNEATGDPLPGYEKLLSINGEEIDLAGGLVRFDSRRCEVDVSSLRGRADLAIRLQLIGGEGEVTATAAIGPLQVDFDSNNAPPISLEKRDLHALPAPLTDTALLVSANDVVVKVSDLAFHSQLSKLTASLRLANRGDVTGRGLFIFLPSLPDGVVIVDPSGVDSNGVPYINMTSAVPPGGLDSGAESLSVSITFMVNPEEAPDIRLQVRTRGPNRPPSLVDVAHITASVGDVQSILLQATDPDGDALRFSIRTDSRLPGVSLNEDGELQVRPAPGMEGDYSFEIVVSDGTLSDSQPVTIAVGSEKLSETLLSGVVLDIDSNPIPGVPVQVGRFRAETDSAGEFTVVLPSFLTPTESFSIQVPTGDPQFDPFNTGAQTIELHRAGYDSATGTFSDNPRRHPNLVSAYLDGSSIYGSDEQRASSLRTHDGTGRLKASDGELLPFNDPATFPEGILENENSSQRDPNDLFVAGDVRANDNVGLMSLHTLLLREHNRKATELAAINPMLSGDELYEYARRWTTALFQHITYQEYLPLLLGTDAVPVYSGYNDSVDSQVGGLFSGAAFRIGHSMAPGELWRLEEDGSVVSGGHVSLGESFFNPDLVVAQGIEPFLLGMSSQPIEAVDAKLRDELRNFLFGPPGAGGLDLIAMNIQRGRDLGLPSYNQTRRDLGLPEADTFEDVTSDTNLQTALAAVYNDIEELDLIVGGLAEDHVDESLVGELFRSILADQYIRTRDGDRFWYENGQFNASDLIAIHATTLATLIERNTGIDSLPPAVFTTGTQAAGAGFGGSPAMELPMEHRSFSGEGNNLTHPNVGAAGQNLSTDYSVGFGDGISSPAGENRPNARDISNAVFAQETSELDASGATTMLMMWGQLLAHDIALTPGGTDDTIKFFGDAASPESTYPFVAESLPEILKHEVFLGVENQLLRPIYLPALNTAQAVTINPATDTLVSVTVREGVAPVELTVKAGTAIGQNGQLYDGPITITEVPVDRLPMSLPDTLVPPMVVTVQPAGIAFTEPVAVTFPNTGNYLPGEKLDLWWINPDTGAFDIVGELEVSSDGSRLETLSGGLPTTSWGAPSPPPLLIPPGESPLAMDPNCGCGGSGPTTIPATSEVELHSGALRESHRLVTYQSLGVDRGLELTYNSLHADPQPIVQFGFRDRPTNIGGLLVAELEFQGDGFEFQVPGYSGGRGLDGGEHFWLPSGRTERVAAAIQADLSHLPSGMYEYELRSGLFRLGTDDRFSGSFTRTAGSVHIVNRIDSPFGAGWSIANHQSIIENIDGTLSLVGGQVRYVFQPDPNSGNIYLSPPGDFSILERLPAGKLRRTMPDQTVFLFNSNHQLESITDRNGNMSIWEYDQQGNPVRWIDPVGLATIFEYENGRVIAITDPTGRKTEFSYDDRSNLMSITDPNSSVRTFEYDSRHRMTSETTKRGFIERVTYDFAGRVRETTRKDGTRIQFRSVQSKILLPASTTIDPENPPPAILEQNATAQYMDANGIVRELLLDRFGQTISERDRSGAIGSFERQENNLVATRFDGRGNATSFEYDDWGNPTRVTDAIIRRNATNTVSFPGEKFPTGTTPKGIVSGDFNNDGILDLVTVNRFSVSTQLGSGDGRFESPRDTEIENGDFVVTAFIDDDDILDLFVITVAGQRFLNVLTGIGDGTFEAATPVQISAVGIEPGDFNGDGRQDFITVNGGFGGSSLYLAQADGTFQFQELIADSTTVTNSVVAVDVNHDGRLDIVGDRIVLVANEDGTFLETQALSSAAIGKTLVQDFDGDGHLDLARLLLSEIEFSRGFGDGTFEEWKSLPTPPGAITSVVFKFKGNLSSGDFDGDGLLDLSVLGRGTDSVHFLYGMGGGEFSDPIESRTGRQPISFVTGDFDRDGRDDIAISNETSSDISVVLGDENHEFPGWYNFANATRIQTVAAGDLNHDGNADVVIVSSGETTNSGFIYNGEIHVLLGDGNGGVLDTASYEVGRIPRAMLIRDLNGDGNEDVAVANFRSHSVSVRLGDGLGGFGDELQLSAGIFPNDIAAGDFNGDGAIDLAVSNNSDRANSVSVLYGNGDGTFQTVSQWSVGIMPQSITVADFNSDGIDDIATSDIGPVVPRPPVITGFTVLLADGLGGFEKHTVSGNAAGRAVSIAALDANNDGIMDLAISMGELLIYLGDGTGSFTETAPFARASAAGLLAARDMNDDGLVDLVSENADGGFSIFINSGEGLVDGGLFTTAYRSHGFAIIDIDNDGLLDVVSSIGSSTSVVVVPGIEPRNTTSSFPVRMMYDSVFSQLTSYRDERRNLTLYAIDTSNGNRLSNRQVVGDVDFETEDENDDLITTFTYESNGLVESVTDPLGRVTSFEYDGFGRLARVSIAVGTPDEATRLFEYDAAGHQTAVVDANGNRTDFEYDDLNRLVRIFESAPSGLETDPQLITEFGYDAEGNLVSTLDSRGVEIRIDYDSLNRSIKSTDALGNTTRHRYDETGNLSVIVNPLGHTQRNTYDERNRVVLSVDPNGAKTRFRFDRDDNLISLTDPVGNTTRFAYDPRNRMIKEIDPLGNSTFYAYDAVDSLIQKMDRNERLTTFAYDDLDRLVEETWIDPDGTTVVNTINYQYDKIGNLLEVFDQSSYLTYTYDSLNRVTTVDNAGTPDAPNALLIYTYDAASNVRTVTDAIDGVAGATTEYEYDALNRVKTIKQSGNDVADKLVDYVYNEIGQYDQVLRYSDLTRTNLVVETDYEYDEINRLADLRHTDNADEVLAFFTYGYDAASRITEITDVNGLTDFSYDNRSQLIEADRSETDPRVDEFYQYDANGNRVASHLHGDGYETGPANRLFSDGTYDYKYDDEGNMTRRTSIETGEYRVFEWDHRNRLRSVTDHAVDGTRTNAAGFVFDVFNRRIRRKIDLDGSGPLLSVNLDFAYDGMDVILGVGSGGAELTRYLHGPGLDDLLTNENRSGVEFSYSDHLGSIIGTLAETTDATDQVSYDSFGLSEVEPNRFGYTGREGELTIGLQYNRARFYDANTGRFLSQDPIGFRGHDENLYRYASNNPVGTSDPLGLQSQDYGTMGAAVVSKQVQTLTSQEKKKAQKRYDALHREIYESLSNGQGVLIGVEGQMQSAPLGGIFSDRPTYTDVVPFIAGYGNDEEQMRQSFQNRDKLRATVKGRIPVDDAFFIPSRNPGCGIPRSKKLGF